MTALTRKLAAEEVAIGSVVTMAEPFVAEIMGAAGFDFVMVDTEHAPLSMHQLQTVLIALQRHDSAVLVRPPANDAIAIKQILDLGADGVVVPNVVSGAACAAAVAAGRYPPHGVRGYGPRRAARVHGGDAEYARTANDEILVFVMIEHANAVADVEAIVTTPGLDGVMVGPTDLAVSMGHIADMQHESVTAAIHHVLEMCRKHSCPVGLFTRTEERTRYWVQAGAQIATLGSDLAFIDTGIGEAKRVIDQIVDRPRA